MLHMRVARHADRLEVNKVESWWCSGENWREKKRAKVHKTSHKSVGSRPSHILLSLNLLSKAFWREDTEISGILAEGHNSDSVEFPQKSGSKPAERNPFCFVRNRSSLLVEMSCSGGAKSSNISEGSSRTWGEKLCRWAKHQVSQQLPKVSPKSSWHCCVEWDLLHSSRV